jgi:hypothetical protein
MGLEEQLAEKLSKEIAREIDNGILIELMVAGGYKKVKWTKLVNASMASWCMENCAGQWDRRNEYFLFKESDDAALFTLRWL